MSDNDDLHRALRQSLLNRLLDAVKYCQNYFGGKRELATDVDNRVFCLLAQLETICYHGLKGVSKTLATLKHVTEKVTRFNLDYFEAESPFWSFLQNFLSEHENGRFYRLKNVLTDVGRCRAWLRAALNEKTLSRYVEMFLGNRDLLEAHYESWAFLRDNELNSTLPQIAAGLSSILFALNIDSENLNCPRNVPEETAELLLEARKPPQPIISVVSSGTNTLQSSRQINFIAADFTVTLVKRRERKKKPLVNVVSFDDNKRLAENDGRMKVVHTSLPAANQVVSAELQTAHSFLLDSWNKHCDSDACSASFSVNVRDHLTTNACQSSEHIAGNLLNNAGRECRSLDLCFENISSPQLSCAEETSSVFSFDASLGMKPEAVSSSPPFCEAGPSLTTLNPETTSLSCCLSPSVSLSDRLEQDYNSKCLSPVSATVPDSVPCLSGSQSSDLQAHVISLQSQLKAQLNLIEALKSDLELSKRHSDSLQIKLEERLLEVCRENELLKENLKKYVQLNELKIDAGSSEDSRSTTSNINSTIQSESDANLEAFFSDYEAKLVQVTEMHGELMEFNEHLQKEICEKNVVIAQLRSALKQNKICISDEPGCGNSEKGNSGRTNSNPTITISVPTAFLTGKGTDIHHVYQIYCCICDAEWNVYRRYSDFYELHTFLKKKDPVIASFKFPAKKIGNKDKKFVEERRKQLEDYLRWTINYVIQNFPEFTSVPVSKETVINFLPFLSDYLATSKGKRSGSMFKSSQ